MLTASHSKCSAVPLLLLVPFFPKCSGSGPAPGAVCAGGKAEGLREGHWWEGAGEATSYSNEPGREGLATPADIPSVEVGAGEVSRRGRAARQRAAVRARGC